MDRIKTEADPLIGQILAGIANWLKHWLHLAIVQRRQYFERFRTYSVRALISAQAAWPVAAQSGQQIRACGIKVAQFPRLFSQSFSAVAFAVAPFGQAFDKSNFPARRTAHQHQHDIVDIQPLAAKLLLPRIIKIAGEAFGLFAGQIGRHLAANDMAVQHQI